MESPKTTQTSFGRVTNRVNYHESPPKRMSKKSSNTSKIAKSNNNNTNANSTNNNRPVRTIQLQQTEWNALGLATQRGENFNVAAGNNLLLGINKIQRKANGIFITGIFLSRNGNTTTNGTKTTNSNTIPAAFLIGTIKSIKNSNEAIDVSNELYDDLSKNLKLPQNYLKYKFGESVLCKKKQSFNDDGSTINNPLKLATVSRLLPHLHAGDDTAEYEIKIDQTGEVRRTGEYCLRPVGFRTDESDGFDTTFNGWANYEHDRANKLKIFEYSKNSNSALDASSLAFYQRPDTAYFNKKAEFYALSAQSLLSGDVLCKMGKFAMIGVIKNVVQSLKPQAHNFELSVSNVGKKKNLKKIGQTIECNVIQALVNDIAPADGDCDEKCNNICEYDNRNMWFSFDSINSLRSKIGVSENDSIIVKDNTTMNLEISDNKKLVFVWIRDDKLLTIESFTYKSSNNSVNGNGNINNQNQDQNQNENNVGRAQNNSNNNNV